MVSVIAKNIRSRREHKSKNFQPFCLNLDRERERERGEYIVVRANSVGLGYVKEDVVHHG